MSASSQVFKRFSVTMMMLAVGLSVGSLLIAPLPAQAQPAAALTENEDSVQRGVDASAARYTALAAHYAVGNDDVQRGVDASAARYTALAEHYAVAALAKGGTDLDGSQ